MKRELKFRAWDEHTKTFAYIDLRNRPPHVNLWQSDDLQQFTGLKDKNGAEVYEGDIVFDENTKRTYKVEFLMGCFFAASFDSIFLTPLAEVYRTIVGNIYENGELLEGKP
jgi:hypothetical protein